QPPRPGRHTRLTDPEQPDDAGAVRGARHRPPRLRRLRLRSGRHRRSAGRPHRASHGSHHRHLRRRPAHHARLRPPVSHPARPHPTPPPPPPAPPTPTDPTGVPAGPGLLIPGPPAIPGAWVLPTSGHVYTGPATHILKTCYNGPTSTPACGKAFASLHAQTLVTYQAASRYWPLQWYETGIFLAAALALAGSCFWWIGGPRPGRTRPSSAQPPRTASTLRTSPAPPATSGHPGR